MSSRRSHHADRLSLRTAAPSVHAGQALTPWSGPTLRQFVARAERSFGDFKQRPASMSHGDGSLRDASRITGLMGSERPSPATLRLLCSQWGLPPEDFDLEAD